MYTQHEDNHATNSAGRLVAFLIVFLLFLSTVFVTAQTDTNVYTEPVGFITLTAQGSGGGSSAYTFWGLGMTRTVTNRGLISSVAGTQISVNQPLTPGQFNRVVTGTVTNPAYYIEFCSGAHAGLMDDIVSNDTAAVYTANDDSSLIAATQAYKIYPHWTLANLFGTNNASGLQGGTGSANADNVQVWNPNTQGYATYYYKTNTQGGGVGWRSASSLIVNAGNTPLYIEQGLVINRRASSSTNFLLVGAVKLGQSISPVVQSGYTFVANLYPAPITLGKSGLYTTNSTTGLAGGTGSANADNVQIWNATTQGYTTYYYKTNTQGGGVGWRSASSAIADASTNSIPAGSTAVILRRLGTPFNWFVPQPF